MASNLKTCYRCKLEFPPTHEYFAKDARSKDGLQCCCKQCNKVYRQRNKERISSYLKSWRESNIEYRRGYFKEYEKSDKYKKYQQYYRLTHDLDYSESIKKWWKEHPEKGRFYAAKRRATLRGLTEHFTEQDINELHLEQEGKCFYCGETYSIYHVEHKIPLSRGGSDTKENLAIACPHCNFTKINKTMEEFFEYNTIKSSCG